MDSQSYVIIAIGPALTDFLYHLNVHLFSQVQQILNAKPGDWICLSTFETITQIQDALSSDPNNHNVQFQAGSSLLANLSAFPENLRRKSLLITSKGNNTDNISLQSQRIFSTKVNELGVNYKTIETHGYNPIGMIFTSAKESDRILTMFPGVSHNLDLSDTTLLGEYLLVSAFELTDGLIASSIDFLIRSKRYKVVLSLSSHLILHGVLLHRIIDYLCSGLIFCLAGNQQEFESLLGVYCPRHIRSHNLLNKTPYGLLTLGKKGMIGAFQETEYYQSSVQTTKIVSTSGCGDIALGAFLSGIIQKKKPTQIMLEAASKASLILSTQSNILDPKYAE